MSYVSDARIMKGAEGICGWHKDDVSHLQKPTRSYITTTSTWTGHSGDIKPSYVYLLFTWASPEIKTPKYLGFFSRIQLLSSNISLSSPASTWALRWRSFGDNAPFEANAVVEHRDFANVRFGGFYYWGDRSLSKNIHADRINKHGQNLTGPTSNIFEVRPPKEWKKSNLRS